MASLLDWQVKPVFPSAEAEEDVWVFSECEEKIVQIEDANFGSLTKKEIAQQLLNDIENIGKKDDFDAFSNWLEEKINVPIFDEIQPVQSAEKLDSEADEEAPDLDDALKDVDPTPPQSPGRKEAEQLLILSLDGDRSILPADEPVENLDPKLAGGPIASLDYFLSSEIASESVQQEIFCDGDEPQSIIYLQSSGSPAEGELATAPPTPMSDLEKEMAVVDEVIRSTARSLEGNFDCCESEACSSGSVVSFGSLESLSADGESDASDWSPSPKKACKKRGKGNRKSRPYERVRKQEDRWMRKKEQNKNAAVRYRLKKKAELSEILEEERMLNEKKGNLEQKVYDIKLEIKYLKGLMRDLFKAKGLLIN